MQSMDQTTTNANDNDKETTRLDDDVEVSREPCFNNHRNRQAQKRVEKAKEVQGAQAGAEAGEEAGPKKVGEAVAAGVAEPGLQTAGHACDPKVVLAPIVGITLPEWQLERQRDAQASDRLKAMKTFKNKDTGSSVLPTKSSIGMQRCRRCRCR